MNALIPPLVQWYRHHARELAWRGVEVNPWAVLVSEVMLAQTPVARVEPAFAQWMARWPTPVELSDAQAGDVIRAWGKLGYPRRALRLHATAGCLVRDYDGQVPDRLEALLSLPGIGDYTARAVLAFAFGQRQPVVDTNVRRVLARAVLGQGQSGPPSTRRDLTLVESLLPAESAAAAEASIALMELGALVCTAKAPRCAQCPVSSQCAWLRAGSPSYTGPTVKAQRFAGTDRQVRGLVLDVLRTEAGPVQRERLDVVWADAPQRQRALESLIIDGLIRELEDGSYSLPS